MGRVSFFNFGKNLGSFEKLFLTIFLYTLLSGALRKWVFSSNLIANFLLGIQMILPFYTFFIRKGYKSALSNKVISVYLLFLFLLALNPKNLTYFHGVFGFIIYSSFFILLSFYLENRDKINLKPLIPIIYFISILEIVLAFIQYQMPRFHWINTYVDMKVLNGDIATVGDAVRVTGTFSFVGGFGAFVVFLGFLNWVIIRELQSKILYLLIIPMSFIVALMSGSRGPTAAFIAITSIGLFFELGSRKFFRLLRSIILAFLVGYVFIVVFGTLGLEKKIVYAIENFQERRSINKDNGEEEFRILWDYYDLRDFRGKYPYLGVGLGATYQGAVALFGLSHYVVEYGYYENELGRIALEGGFLLLAIRTLMIIYFLSLLNINFAGKFILLVLLGYFLPLIFNVYNSSFIALGLIFIDSVSVKSIES